MIKYITCFILSLIIIEGVYSQDFIPIFNSSDLGGGCYEVTPAAAGMTGLVWYDTQLDLNEPFDIEFSMYFDTDDAWGADGMCFILQDSPQDTNATGIAGSYMGCGNISPMLGVEFDIFDSGTDFDEVGMADHLGIFQNGDNRHHMGNYLAGPVLTGELETGAYHDFRVTWNPETQIIDVYMNCTLRLSDTLDIINNIFSGNSMVWWGFSGGGGFCYANLIVCDITKTVSTINDTLTICAGDSVMIDATSYPGSNVIWTPLSNIDNPTSFTPNVYPPVSTTYFMSYVDQCGILRTNYDSIHINVNQIVPVDLGPDTAICDGESLTLDAGPTGVSYTWSPGGVGFQTSIVDSTYNYAVTVTDVNGCNATDDINLLVNALPNSFISGNLEICYGDSTTLFGNGGDLYVWSTGSVDTSIYVGPLADSIYFVTVTDTNTTCISVATDTLVVHALPVPSISGDFSICYGDTALLVAAGADSVVWSTGSNSDSIYVVPVNDSIYYLTVIDTATLCYDTTSDTVFVKPLPNVGILGDTAICYGDSGMIYANGGDSYIWSTLELADTIYVNPLADSTYTVIGTDVVTTCSNIDSFTVVVHPLPVIGIIPDTAICEGTSVDLYASGGASYSWSPNLALTDVNISNPTATPEFTVTYTVEVTTVYGCIDSADVTVTINDLPAIALDGDSVSCNGSANGSVWVSYVGANGPYSYYWNTNQTDSVITGLSGGLYMVTATNSFGCTYSQSLVVHEPAVLSDTALVTHLQCYNDSSGAINLIVTGGTAPYTYVWSSGDTIPNLSGLSADQYNVMVSDENDCKIVANINVTQPDSLIAILSATDASCYDYTDGSVSVLVSGGTQPYYYNWSTGAVTELMTNIGYGTYSVIVADTNNCLAYDTIIVNQPELLQITDSIIVDPGCLESSDGEICVLVTGGTGTYQYNWSNNEMSDHIYNLYGGEYTLTVTDFNSCEAIYSKVITNPQETCLLIPTFFTPNGDGYNDKWEILGIEFYPESEIEIYNRWGDKIFSSKGYNEMWDGTYNGSELPLGTFVYILNLNDDAGSEPIQGLVTIKR